MSNTVIQVDNVGKKYLLQHRAKERYTALRDVLTGNVARLARGIFNPQSKEKANPSREWFWALKGACFKAKCGEVIGIIGRNGAGKSTLLKILSRITEPTTGQIRIKGRVASLLEVGTGFHPELSGRENIFLNGAILGMSKSDIKKRLDQIIDFAEIEKFIDTPVKRYSSGMYLRLAFAVAAHLEPEILLMDEVLAVGDANFQKKCLGKLEYVSNSGRTILFVSHNMVAIRQFCSRVIWLDNGCIVADGNPDEVVEKYLLSSKLEDTSHCVGDMERNEGHGEKIRILNCELIDSDSQPTNTLKFGEPFEFLIESRLIGESALNDLSVVVGIDSGLDHTRIASCASEESELLFSIAKNGMLSVRVRFDNISLSPGRYFFTVALRTGRFAILDRVPQCLRFDILDVPHEGNNIKTYLAGYLRLRTQWSFKVQNHHFNENTRFRNDSKVRNTNEQEINLSGN